MSERTARLDHLLREEISAIIAKEIVDPRIGFVTVTSVEVTPDLGHATVWVSAIGSADERRASLRALGRAMPFVRHRLGGLRLKRIPQLHVREDDTAVRGTRVMRILDELRESQDEPAEEVTDAADATGALPTPGPARSLPDIPPPPLPSKPVRASASTQPQKARKPAKPTPAKSAKPAGPRAAASGSGGRRSNTGGNRGR